MTDGKGFYEQQEVIDIITIMTAVLSPDVDWAMAGVLRSPYGGLTDQEILGLLRMYPQKNLWESLSQSIEPSHVSLWKKLTVLMHVSRLGSLPELLMPSWRRSMWKVSFLLCLMDEKRWQTCGNCVPWLLPLPCRKGAAAKTFGQIEPDAQDAGSGKRRCLGTGRQKRADHDHPQVQRVGISRCFYRINSINRLLTGSAFSIFPALVLAL